jgi:hypothetical protein
MAADWFYGWRADFVEESITICGKHQGSSFARPGLSGQMNYQKLYHFSCPVDQLFNNLPIHCWNQFRMKKVFMWQ